MTEWNQTKKFISGGLLRDSMGGLLRDSMPWLTEEKMVATFGPGEGPYDPEKGYSQEWAFEHPSFEDGFTVYFRRGRSSIGGGVRTVNFHGVLDRFESWLRAQLEPPPEEAKKCVESGVKSSKSGYNGDMRTTGKKKDTTINWLISFVGDHGDRHSGAPHADILSEGRKAGHSESTLRLYLRSAAGCGHVKPEPTGNAPYTRCARRPVYFERVRRDKFILSPMGKARYHRMNDDVSRPRVTVTHDTSGSMSKSELAVALAEAEGIPVIHITDGMKRVQVEDVLDLAAVDPVNLEINEESRVKSSKPGYNGDMLTLSDAACDVLNDYFEAAYMAAYASITKRDPGYSYEDTLYLTVELVPNAVGVCLSQLVALAEELDVGEDDVIVSHDSGVTKVTFVSHLNDVKWWLLEEPKRNAPHPGMEFELPNNFDCSLF